MDILQQLSTSPYVTLSGWVATVIALVLAIFFFFAQKRRKIISYSYQTNRIVSDKLSEVQGLTITYNEDTIEKLSITNIIIANAGNTIVEESDFYDKKRLKIVTDDKEIKFLSAKITSQSSETIEGSVEIINSEVCVNFQALERKDTVCITIYHTGDVKTDFILDGKIKDGGKIIDEGKSTEDDVIASNKKLTHLLTTSMILVLFVALFCLPSLYFKEKKIAELTGIVSTMATENERLHNENAGLKDDMKSSIEYLNDKIQSYEEQISQYEERMHGYDERLNKIFGAP